MLFEKIDKNQMIFYKIIRRCFWKKTILPHNIKKHYLDPPKSKNMIKMNQSKKCILYALIKEWLDTSEQHTNESLKLHFCYFTLYHIETVVYF